MYEVKTKPTDASVEQYLNLIEEEQKRLDSFQLMEMMREITNEEPVLWGTSLIGFGKVAYKNKSGFHGYWGKVGFSPRKQNLTIYSLTGWADHADLLAKLGKHKLGIGCLYINKLSQVDMSVLREIISRSFQATLSPEHADE
jgi:hypothetical protein